MILALPTLAMLALGYFALIPNYPMASIDEYLYCVLMLLVCVTIAGIPTFVWLLLGIASFVSGAWLLLASRSRDWLSLGAILSMFPILVLVLGIFFWDYRGP